MDYVNVSGSHERGFTLIEAMIVVIIIGVIAAMAYPSMSSQIAEMRIKSAKTTIASSIKDAQAQSAILRKPIYIVFSGSENVTIVLSDAETITESSTLAKYELPAASRLMSGSSDGVFRVTPAGILQKKNGSNYAPVTHVFYVCDSIHGGNTSIGLKYQNRSTPIAQTTETTICP